MSHCPVSHINTQKREARLQPHNLALYHTTIRAPPGLYPLFISATLPSMPAETTPLLSHVNQAVAGLWTRRTAERVQTVASERAADVRASVMRGHFSLRLLVLLGGVALIILALFGFFWHILLLNFTAALMELFTLALGGVILVLESRQLSLPSEYMEKLLKYALFLKFIWGRGLLYCFAGALQAMQGSTADLVIGLYIMLLGLVFIALGYITAQKLALIGRRSFNSLTIKRKFQEANTDRTGQLTLEQFGVLLDSMDIPLNNREKEIAFLYLDTTDRGTLTVDEFQAWFQEDTTTAIL